MTDVEHYSQFFHGATLTVIVSCPHHAISRKTVDQRGLKPLLVEVCYKVHKEWATTKQCNCVCVDGTLRRAEELAAA